MKKSPLNSIFFPVKKVPVQELLPEYNTTSGLSHFVIAPGLNGQDMILNVCSNDYNLMPNKELFDPILEKLGNNYNIQTRIRQQGYTRFTVDFMFLDLSISAMIKDSILPRMSIRNSYDGSSRFTISFGFYRVVCSNGLMVPDKDAKAFSFMHTFSLTENWEDTKGKVELFLDKAPEIAEVYDPLIGYKRSYNSAIERINEVIEDTNYPPTLKESVQNRLDEEINRYKFEPSDWLVYNALNWGLFNSGISNIKDQKKEQIDMKTLEYLLNS